MSYASLMVYVEADAIPEQRVRLAANLADKFAAMLIGVSALAIPPPVVADGMVMAELTDDDIELMRARLADKGNWFRRIAGGDHRRLDWHAALDFPTEALARAARSADLVLIGQVKAQGSAYRSLDPGEAILKMGRPTLVVPEGMNSLSSRACRDRLEGYARSAPSRAGRASVPARGNARDHCRSLWAGRGEDRIGTARRRSSLSVVPPHQRRAQSHAGAKGIWCSAVDPDRSGGTGGPVVTGAYGHSRLGEWIFGGMTRELLATSPICCLMSH